MLEPWHTSLVTLAPAVSSPPAATPPAWIALGAALIGATAALATPVIKDIFVSKIINRRTKIETQRDVYRLYLAPLSETSQKLMWRFNEVFISGRHQWLKTTTQPLEYNQYKRQSTLYRIGCLLGWIRAINLELSALPRGSAGFTTPILESIAAVQKALADGPYVEQHRLEQLCRIWNLDISTLSAKTKNDLGTKLEVLLYNLAGDELKRDSAKLKEFSTSKKIEICTSLAGFLTAKLQIKNLSNSRILESITSAVESLSFRESLIYRDWQDAIGDALIERDSDSERRFKVIGYEKFGEVISTDRPWMEVFKVSIEDIDFEIIDSSDFRVQQLRDLADAVSDIVIAIAQSEEGDLVTPEALATARALRLRAPLSA